MTCCMQDIAGTSKLGRKTMQCPLLPLPEPIPSFTCIIRQGRYMEDMVAYRGHGDGKGADRCRGQGADLETRLLWLLCQKYSLTSNYVSAPSRPVCFVCTCCMYDDPTSWALKNATPL